VLPAVKPARNNSLVLESFNIKSGVLSKKGRYQNLLSQNPSQESLRSKNIKLNQEQQRILELINKQDQLNKKQTLPKNFLQELDQIIESQSHLVDFNELLKTSPKEREQKQLLISARIPRSTLQTRRRRAFM
jgi:phenylalanine-4-hydroxylase